jgi:hypothetical protein
MMKKVNKTFLYPIIVHNKKKIKLKACNNEKQVKHEIGTYLANNNIPLKDAKLFILKVKFDGKIDKDWKLKGTKSIETS